MSTSPPNSRPLPDQTAFKDKVCRHELKVNTIISMEKEVIADVEHYRALWDGRSIYCGMSTDTTKMHKALLVKCFSAEKSAETFLPPPLTAPSLKQLSLLKLMSNFRSGEEFDAYLKGDGNGIVTQVVENVYDEIVKGCEQ